jgi:hypothetical protein
MKYSVPVPIVQYQVHGGQVHRTGSSKVILVKNLKEISWTKWKVLSVFYAIFNIINIGRSKIEHIVKMKWILAQQYYTYILLLIGTRKSSQRFYAIFDIINIGRSKIKHIVKRKWRSARRYCIYKYTAACRNKKQWEITREPENKKRRQHSIRVQ